MTRINVPSFLIFVPFFSVKYNFDEVKYRVEYERNQLSLVYKFVHRVCISNFIEIKLYA